MANYEVTITDGVGSRTMNLGTYTVSATSAPGYDLSTLTPTSYTVDATSQTGAFTLSANGTLTINFNETGEAGGIPITAGSVAMTNSTGETQYGTVTQIDTNGVATFNNVPYGSAQAPYTLYFKQLTSDATHNIYPGVFMVNMGAQTQTKYVQNTPITSLQNFTLTDANYTDLPINSATLSFAENA